MAIVAAYKFHANFPITSTAQPLREGSALVSSAFAPPGAGTH